ncbi:GGDEF domain-containing protein [Actinoplanes sp. NPDC051851]|uniref:GGDEF domain-containing protein n=1 Tax=Actinoplanes sp. NPDC051851 TaxID=3154753 RepID=UPI0034342B92
MRITAPTGRRVPALCALLGLVAGFVVLAVGGMLAANTTQRAVETVTRADRITAAWDSTLVLVTQENEAVNDYLRAPDRDGLSAVIAQIGSAEPTLAWLSSNAGRGDARRVQLTESGYRSFTQLQRDLVAAAEQGRATEAADTGAQVGMSAAALRKMLAANLTAQRYQLRAELIEVEATNTRLREIGVYVVVVDATLLVICAALLLGYQRRVERQAANSRYQASHDALTGLANRRLFNDRLESAVHAAVDGGSPVGLLLIDLDGFKAVNDALGHQAGDTLLKAVATRITAAVRHTDIVARLGGDEFAVILPAISSYEQSREIAAIILAAVEEPVPYRDATATVSASIGISLCPGDTTDPAVLFHNADAAMYHAKRGRRGIVCHDETRPSVAPAA